MANYKFSSTTINSTRLRNSDGGAFIVSDGYKLGAYASLSNVINTKTRNKGLTDVSIDVSPAELETLFKIGPLMIIVKDIADPNKAEIFVMAFDNELYQAIRLNSQGGAKKHRCYIVERKFFDGKNGSLPDGFYDIQCDAVRIQVGREDKKDYFIILNNLTKDENGVLILADKEIGYTGTPPAVGVKTPPR